MVAQPLLRAPTSNKAASGIRRAIRSCRICQSSIHLLVEQTNTVAGIRFAYFFVQAICMIAMGILVAISVRG